jgi:hypothetical protein
MLTESQVVAIIGKREVDLTPLVIQDVEVKPEGRGGPDIALRFTWEDWSAEFLGEIVASSTPKAIDGAIAAACRYATGKGLPMVIAPYLSPKSLQRFLDEQVSAMDLGGNAVILVPGRMAVFRTGAPNKYPASREIKSIYEGKSSLVPRVFLLRSGFGSVTEIMEEIKAREGEISLGTVSKVLKGLEDDLVVRKEPAIEVLQPDRLLENLVESYATDRVKARKSTEVKLDIGPDTLWRLRRICDDQGLRCVSGTMGSRDPVPESGPLDIYVEDLDRVLGALELTPVNRFATARFLESRDDRVYFDRRDREGFYWLSPVQRYLELAVAGKREREQGVALRDLILGGDADD